ncbi:hypothetical protein Tco_0575438 [Tanacetum coccineum]
MADNRTMAQLLQAPTEGYEDAIVIPEINANFELKHGLINLVQNKQNARSQKDFNKDLTNTFYELELDLNELFVHATSRIFLKLHQLDNFYWLLNANDQDSLNSAAGGNFWIDASVNA